MSNIQHRHAEFAKLLNATVKYVKHDIENIDSLKLIRDLKMCVNIFERFTVSRPFISQKIYCDVQIVHN